MENYQECVKAAQKAIETVSNRPIFKIDGLNKMQQRWVSKLKRELEVAMKHYDTQTIISIIYTIRDFTNCKNITIMVAYLKYQLGELQF